MIYRVHKWIAVAAFAAGQSFFVFDLNISRSLIDTLITCLSITLGFSIAAVATIFGSAYSADLANLEDPDHAGQSSLRTLHDYFWWSCLWSFTALGGLIILLISDDQIAGSDPLLRLSYVLKLGGMSIDVALILISVVMSAFATCSVFSLLVFRLMLNALIYRP